MYLHRNNTDNPENEYLYVFVMSNKDKQFNGTKQLSIKERDKKDTQTEK